LKGALSRTQRSHLIKTVLSGKVDITKACDRYGISRPTFYKWLRRYRDAGGVISSLENGNNLTRVSGNHPFKKSQEEVDRLTELVVAHPEWSCSALVNNINEFSHGSIQRILKENHLNTFVQRLAFRDKYLLSHPQETLERAPTPITARWFIPSFLQLVRRHIPTGLASPPPALFNTYRLLGTLEGLIVNTSKVLRSSYLKILPPSPSRSFALKRIGIIFSSLASLLGIVLINKNLLSETKSTASAIGLLFSEVSLLFGTFFFLYSARYYLSLVLVLLFSRRKSPAAGTIRTGEEIDEEGVRKNIFDPNETASLESFLPEIINSSSTQPFISIHLPYYNEKRVAERSIRAAAAQDYTQFEVLVCDDSTDETVEIVDRTAVSINQEVSDKIRQAKKGYYQSLVSLASQGDSAAISKLEEVWAAREATRYQIQDNGYKVFNSQSKAPNNKNQVPNFESLAVEQLNQLIDDRYPLSALPINFQRVRILHRPTRAGFKGAALGYALKAVYSATEYIIVLDADFVPFADTILQFLKYYKLVSYDPRYYGASSHWGSPSSAGKLGASGEEIRDQGQGTGDQQPVTSPQPLAPSAQIISYDQANRLAGGDWQKRLQHSNLAAVQGYQWHILNKNENWITRGVRTEYSGSYIIERSSDELMGSLKQISGAVYMIRRDPLEKVGWKTSITEDFQLSLRLYEQGYKVAFTPYIQAPSECVSTLKRLIRQRMRWAEGHSHNIRQMFLPLIKSPKLSAIEKIQVLYLSPYYLQAAFFMVGNLAWFLAETIFRVRLPFWTSLWGWSLVFSNLFALPLMNGVGMFVEEAEERDYLGLLSFVVLCYLVIPFQAWAAIKGFMEKEEGTWFRTPKTGNITIDIVKGSFSRLLGLFKGTRGVDAVGNEAVSSFSLSKEALSNLSYLPAYVSEHTAYKNFYELTSLGTVSRRVKGLAPSLIAGLSLFSIVLFYFTPFIPTRADPTGRHKFGIASAQDLPQSVDRSSASGEAVSSPPSSLSSSSAITVTDNRQRNNTDLPQEISLFSVLNEGVTSSQTHEDPVGGLSVSVSPSTTPDKFFIRPDTLLALKMDQWLNASGEHSSISSFISYRRRLEEKLANDVSGIQVKGEKYLPYHFVKRSDGLWEIYNLTVSGLQRYTLFPDSNRIQLDSFPASDPLEMDFMSQSGVNGNIPFSSSSQQQAVSRPVFEYQDAAGQWREYLPPAAAQLAVVEQTASYLVIEQSYDLTAPQADSPLVRAITRFKLGYTQELNNPAYSSRPWSYVSKLTFILQGNGNLNRLMWETRILGAGEDEVKEGASSYQFRDLKMDWSDFDALQEQIQHSIVGTDTSRQAKLLFYPEGVSGTLEIDPRLSLAVAAGLENDSGEAELTHYKWEKSGRTFKTDIPNQYVYKSSIGQKNVDLGNGQYAPYVWNADEKTLKFANSELKLNSNSLEFYSDGEKLNTLAIHPETKENGNWEKKPAVVLEPTVEEIDEGGAEVRLKVSYKISTEDQESVISFDAGANNKVNFDFNVKALEGGQQRLAVEFDQPAQPISRRDRQANLLSPTSYRFNKSWWAFEENELDTHKVELGEKTAVYLGEKNYKKGETLRIHPDVWGGATQWANEDANEAWNGAMYLDGRWNNFVYLDGSGDGGAEFVSWQFDNVAMSGTIDTTSKLVLAKPDPADDSTPGNIDWTLRAEDTLTPVTIEAIDFNLSNRTTLTTANETGVGQAGSLTITGADFAGILQELVDSYTYDGDDTISFIARTTASTGDWWSIVCDISHATGDPASLEIVYLTAADIQVDVANRYRADMRTGDTNDYLLIYDRAQNDSSPLNTYELPGPYIYEADVEYALRFHATRRTTILESSSVRVRIRVEGCFDTAAGGACLGATDFTVIEDLTFTTEGIYVSNITDFNTGGVALDTPGADNNGYNFLTIDGDIQDDAFGGTMYYGDGATEASSAVDATFEETNTYAVFPAVDASGYQSGFVGIQRAGWLDQPGGTESWRIDFNYFVNIDRLQAREGNSTPTGLHYAKWYFLLQAENDLDAEGERESFNNDNYNPDVLTYTTGSEWDEMSGGSAKDAPSGASPGVKFDGSNDYVSVPYSSDFDMSSNFTVEFWFSPTETWDSTTAVANNAILSRSSDAGNYFSNSDWAFFLFNGVGSADDDDGRMRFGTYGGNIQTQTDEWTDGQWYHIAVAFTSSTNATIYVNGVADNYNSDYNPGTVDGTENNPLEIGRGEFDTAVTSPGYFPGRVDEVRIWDDVRTASEIQENMFKQVIPSSEVNLVGYWKLNENTGTSTFDETTNNNDGTLTGGPIWTTGFVPDAYNEAEGAYTVDASGSQVELDIDGGSNVSNTLAGAESAGDTSIVLTSSDDFPDGGGVTTSYAYINGDKFSFNDNDTATETLSGIPSSGELSIVGHAAGSVVAISNRHKPNFKIRNYRLNDKPSSVTMEGAALVEGTDYNVDYKPVSDAYFADELTWASTLEDSNAVTSPDIGDGTGSSIDSATFAAGKYGNGMQVDATTENPFFVSSGNISGAAGVIEFWYKYTGTAAASGYFFACNNGSGTNNMTLGKGGNTTDIDFIVDDGTAHTNSWDGISVAIHDGSWHHIRLTYDSATDVPDLYLDNILQTRDATSAWSSITPQTNTYIGNDDSDNEIGGIIDEFRVYSPLTGGVDDLAQGGDTTDASEYLFSEAQDYTLDFEADDASNRGEYLFLGSDSMVSGFNFDLATVGVSSSADLYWEYWNGSAWASLEAITGFTDGTSNLTQDGAVYWTANPTNWRPYSVNGSADLYYIRVCLESGSLTTSPIENFIKTDILILQYLANITSADQTLIIVPENLWALFLAIPLLPLMVKRKTPPTRRKSLQFLPLPKSQTGKLLKPFKARGGSDNLFSG